MSDLPVRPKGAVELVDINVGNFANDQRRHDVLILSSVLPAARLRAGVRRGTNLIHGSASLSCAGLVSGIVTLLVLFAQLSDGLPDKAAGEHDGVYDHIGEEDQCHRSGKACYVTGRETCRDLVAQMA